MNAVKEKSTLKIGDVTLKNRFVLAPMAGFTDAAMRLLCARGGAGLTVTEMVSAKGLVYGGANTARLLMRSDEEKPTCLQLFGHEPEFFREALSRPETDGFDMIDINMGCPVPKIVRSGDGSALLLDRDLAAKIVSSCALAAKGRPVTVKIRSGFYEGENIAVDFARAMVDAGASAVVLHARTRAMGYSGESDWDTIERLASSLPVPVIGSGDACEGNAAALLARADGVMIGRAAIGDPWIFSRLNGKTDPMSKKETMISHFTLMEEFYGERYAAVNIRKHVGYYLRGVKGARELKLLLTSVNGRADFLAAMEFFDGVSGASCGT